MTPQEEAARFILHDPVAAHLYFFEHRHTDETPEYHEETIRDIWDFTIPKLLKLIFRGGAKSTLMEEALILLGCIGAFRYPIIVGDTESRAKDRLTAIKHEFMVNQRILNSFGNLIGEPWGAAEAKLSTNILYRAIGRNQSIRGTKFLDFRPDFLFLDDVENEDSTHNEEQIDKTISWIMSVMIPLMDPHKKIIRMASTVIHPNAACVQFSKDASWVTRKIPVFYYNDNHVLESAWPSRFPLYGPNGTLALQEEFNRTGKAREFAQEYLCEAETSETKAFPSTLIPINHDLIHTFEPTIILIDPARTAKASSSLTGYVVISWLNNKLIIWEADGLTIRPSDIINLIFTLSERYNPVFIGVEKDGLEEFIMQPLRQEMARRQSPLPIVPLKAPRGKLEFIKGLEPYLTQGEIEAAQPVPLLQAQIRNFPAGKIDTLNALAYALHMHPGEPVYQNFIPDEALYPNLLEELPKHRKVIYALNATSTECAGAVLTLFRNKLAIIFDTVIEGAPVATVQECLSCLRAQAARNGSVVIPAAHGARYQTLGFKSALFHMGERPGLGSNLEQGRPLFQQRIDRKSLSVSDEAKWTLRALVGGYAYDANSKEPRKNSYRTLMEAIEAAIPILTYDIGEGKNYAIDPRSGKQYLTSRPQR